MEIIILIAVSLGASCLTFFCGFGLGTMLTPVFYMLSGDLVLAIMMTTVVHFFNNVFKFTLMRKSIDWKIALKFGLAAIPAALLGALLIEEMEDVLLLNYTVFGGIKEIYLMNLVFGLVLIVFALIEVIPKWSMFIANKSLIFGGILSGFFGGLSGHQGALRTAFLVKYKLEKEVFIATGIVIALAVDLVRFPIYLAHEKQFLRLEDWTLISIALAAALTGAILGKLLLKKMNIHALTIFVSLAMLVFGLFLALGFLNK